MTFRSRALLDLARDRDCTAEIPGVCNYRSETVVSCHRNGGGTGTKVDDFLVAWCCSACHDYIDARTHRDVPTVIRDLYWQRAHENTLRIMFMEGLLTVTDHAPREKVYKRPSKILCHRGYSR